MSGAELAAHAAEWGAAVAGALGVAWRVSVFYAPRAVITLAGWWVSVQGGEHSLPRAELMRRGLTQVSQWIARAFGRVKEEDWRKLAHDSAARLEAWRKSEAAKEAKRRARAQTTLKRRGAAFLRFFAFLGAEIKDDGVKLARFVERLFGASRRRDARIAKNFAALQAVMGGANVEAHIAEAQKQIAEIEHKPMRQWKDSDWGVWSSAQRYLAEQGAPVDEARASHVAAAHGLVGAQPLVGITGMAVAGATLKGKLIAAAAPVALVAALAGAWLYERHAASEARAAGDAPCAMSETMEGAKRARQPCIALGQSQRAEIALGLKYDALARAQEQRAAAHNVTVETKAAAARVANQAQKTKRLSNVAKKPSAGADLLLPSPDLLRLEPLEAPERIDAGSGGGAGAGDSSPAQLLERAGAAPRSGAER